MRFCGAERDGLGGGKRVWRAERSGFDQANAVCAADRFAWS
jgi:hypothetical protein